jgi:hypothetical protein
MRAYVRWCVAAAAVFACGCSPNCDDVLCGPCPPALSLDIIVPGGAVPTVTGSPALVCESASGMTYCSSNDAVPGDYVYTVAAEGRPARSVTLTVGPAGSGCCTCAVEAAYARVSFEILDGGP